MEKNNQPLILGIVVVGAVLIIALALIFTRNGDQPEEATESNVAQNDESNGETENGEDPDCDTQEAANNPECLADDELDSCAYILKADGSCGKQITCNGQTYDLESDDSWLDENGVYQTVCEPAEPPTGILPDNWEQLTPREKTDLNPFNCDHKTQWISAEDGSCLIKECPGENEFVSVSGFCISDIDTTDLEYVVLLSSSVNGAEDPELVGFCELNPCDTDGFRVFDWHIAIKESIDVDLYTRNSYHLEFYKDPVITQVQGELQGDESWGIPRFILYAHNGSTSLDDYSEADIISRQTDLPAFQD